MLTSSFHTGRKHVVVALSGGVDSSVAAALSNGTTGIHMSNWSYADDDAEAKATTTCDHDFQDAQLVAQHLGIPIRRVRFESEYWVSVFEPFVHATATTEATGNPDMLCNRHIKFGVLPQYLKRFWNEDDTTLVTGHYARLLDRRKEHLLEEALSNVPEQESSSCLIDWLRPWGGDPSIPLLLSAVDETKDQSYFLATSRGHTFRNVSFPLGDYCKNSSYNDLPSVRDLATQLQLPTANKRESMGICFIGKKRKFSDFMSNYLDPSDRPVSFVDIDSGETVGETQEPSHSCLFTTGQGAKISGASCKYFCLESSRTTNSVLVCAGTDHPALYSSWFTMADIDWWMGVPPVTDTSQLRVQCRTRHLHPLVGATLCLETRRVQLDQPVRAVTVGQYAVLYLGAVCLGGGPVAAVERPAVVDTLFRQQQQQESL